MVVTRDVTEATVKSMWSAASDRDWADNPHEERATSEPARPRCSCGSDAVRSTFTADGRPVPLCQVCYDATYEERLADMKARVAAAMKPTKVEQLISLANTARCDGDDDLADVLVIRAKVAAE